MIFKFSFFRYGLVGVLSVCVDFILLFAFFDILRFSLDISVTASFLISSIFNFSMHRNYTFKKFNSKMSYQLLKYILLVFVSYFITVYSINYLVDIGWDIYISKFISVCIVYIYGYLFGKYFVFKG